MFDLSYSLNLLDICGLSLTHRLSADAWMVRIKWIVDLQKKFLMAQISFNFEYYFNMKDFMFT